MEPVSVIGLVGAVVGIVNVVGHSAVLLSNLRARLRAADLTVTLLIGQLNTVKAALRQIQLWLEESSTEDSNHFQLSLDLESSLSSCGILVELIDDQLSMLEWDEKDILKFESRARIILEDARTKECLNYLGHLISSLNLLIIAFKWYLKWQFAFLTQLICILVATQRTRRDCLRMNEAGKFSVNLRKTPPRLL